MRGERAGARRATDGGWREQTSEGPPTVASIPCLCLLLQAPADDRDTAAAIHTAPHLEPAASAPALAPPRGGASPEWRAPVKQVTETALAVCDDPVTITFNVRRGGGREEKGR